jgi:hypothetical protein
MFIAVCWPVITDDWCRPAIGAARLTELWRGP